MASNVRTVADYAGIDDWKNDPWGCAMVLHFAICDVLDAIGASGPLARWEYRRGSATAAPVLADLAALDDGDPASPLAMAVVSGEISSDQLEAAGDVLCRYESLVKLSGRDY